MKNNNVFYNKLVLITGHTGFKGSWLMAWLKHLGAHVIGLSDCVPTKPSHFNVLDFNLDRDFRIDIRNREEVVSSISDIQPDFIFHLAAQPIVFEAYKNPYDTFAINAMGTASILEYLRYAENQCVAILVTSDKCYDNVEWTFGYRETDSIGGKDPYSGSKGAAELVVKSYFESFLSKLSPRVKIGVGRAGNVIGGGDWAPFRIVPDLVRSWSLNEKPEIRCPQATRPWQHVLEPLSGYLTLAHALFTSESCNGEAFNFGPPTSQNFTVEQLIEEIMIHWDRADWVDKSDSNKAHAEAGLLKLCCDKALHQLGWKATLSFKETAKWTADWYKSYYQNGTAAAQNITLNQIENYMNLSKNRNTFNLNMK